MNQSKDIERKAKKAAKPAPAKAKRAGKRSPTSRKAVPKSTRKPRPSAKNVAGEITRIPRRPDAPPSYPLALIPQAKAEPTPAERFRMWCEHSDDAMGLLCAFIVGGGHLFGFCNERDFPYAMVRRWIDADERRVSMYARAREDRADTMADQIQAIADESVETPIVVKEQIVGYAVDMGKVADKKVRLDARKWLAGKMKPRIYGDKNDIEGPQAPVQSVSDEALVAQLRAMGVEVAPLPGPDYEHIGAARMLQ